MVAINLLGLFFKRNPWIAHVHVYPVPPKEIKDSVNQWILLRLADIFIGVSRSVSSEVCKVYGVKESLIHTVHNGMPLPSQQLPRSLSGGNGPPVFGMASRLARDKGIFEFVYAARAILDEIPNATFVLAGEGPLKDEVVDLVEKLGLKVHFALPGFVVAMESFWRSLDVALFTAPREPFGLRIIEPMAVGIPVVAFQTGAGSDEIIEDYKSGFLIDVGDYEKFTNKCCELVRDGENWRRSSLESIKSVEDNLSIGLMCRNINTVYKQVLLVR